MYVRFIQPIRVFKEPEPPTLSSQLKLQLKPLVSSACNLFNLQLASRPIHKAQGKVQSAVPL